MLEKMKKIKWFLILILLISFGYIIIFNIQNYFLKKELNQYWIKDQNDSFKLLNYESIRCNWNIFKPEFAFVTKNITLNKYTDLEIYFYNPNKLFFQNNEEWEKYHIGATDVKNITFKNLLSMVKQDCYQFQESGSVGLEDNAVQWVYSKAEDPKKNEEREKKRKEKEKREREEWNKLSQEEKDKILEENKKIDEYQKLSDEEKLKILREKFKD